MYQGNIYVDYFFVCKVKMYYEFMLVVLVHVQDLGIFPYPLFYVCVSPFSKSLGMIVIMLYFVLFALSHSAQNSHTSVATNDTITENS